MIFGASFLVGLVGVIVAGHALPVGLAIVGIAVVLLVTGAVLQIRDARRLRSGYQRRRFDTGGKAGRRGIDDADSLSTTYDGGNSGSGGGGGGD
ncbi:hypothetical protein ACFWPK_16120 [Nocardia sp. NPDC058519]|uniref:hypothetical protein n=1 Tax=Nocardia sp. NPDC058519 TaxID=3346535 RepID=UPI00366204AC